MKLQQLKAFLTVLELGNFSRAALELGTAQSTVSYAVAELEKELGVKLLERGRFGAEPTDVGERVAAHARGIFQLTDAVQQEADLTKGKVRGTLRVTTFRSAAGRILPKIIAQLRKPYPELSIKILEIDNESASASKRQLVKDRQADLAFIDNSDEDEELLSWTLDEDRFQALLPLSDRREVWSWADAATDSLILSGNDDICGSYVRSRLASLQLQVTPGYEVKEDSTVLRMVSEELGVGLLPELAIDALPENVKMVPTDVVLERPIHIALLPSSLKIPAVRVFLNALKKQFPESDLPRLELSPSPPAQEKTTA